MALSRIDPNSVKPGDIIPVKVDGILHNTVIDEHGIQRFVEDLTNPWYQRLRDYIGTVVNPNGDIRDLNELAVYHAHGKISTEEYAKFNMDIGYSVGGFCDLSSFQAMDIDNPLWETSVEPDSITVKEYKFIISDAGLESFQEMLTEILDECDSSYYGTRATRAEVKEVILKILEL